MRRCSIQKKYVTLQKKQNSRNCEYMIKLALTRIGDLLLDNVISKTEDDKTIENVFLDIPPYQRPYKWSTKNVYQLIEDIDTARKENKEVYRIGTLILHHDEKENKYNIVDGQQRITTLALLLYYLTQQKISFLNREINVTPTSAESIRTNYMAINRHVDKDDTSLCQYSKENCEMIVIVTDDLSEAFQFFDSQNSRGKKLYPHDLLKAYHLREMGHIDAKETEDVVSKWENKNQYKLANLFNDYLYKLKEWTKGNLANELTESNIHLFKGVSARDNHPYAQFYKSAYCYADSINNSSVPFVTGIQRVRPFQLDAPVIAGKPFFDYTSYYFDILKDIQDNSKYEGYFINDNVIVKTLELSKYKYGVGNTITRQLFDIAILLYVDRFCPDVPSKEDLRQFDQFVILAFIWAYSLRAQYSNVGWRVAQNFILGGSAKKNIRNSFNIYKYITEADSPSGLLSSLVQKLKPIKNISAKKDDMDVSQDGVRLNYLYFFKQYNYLEEV